MISWFSLFLIINGTEPSPKGVPLLHRLRMMLFSTFHRTSGEICNEIQNLDSVSVGLGLHLL